jgi:uncharacterized membrane protein
MLVGLFLTAPVVATILIFRFLFRFATAWIPTERFPEWAHFLQGYPLRVISLLVLLAALYLVGLLVRSFIGRRLYQLGDRVLEQIPLIKGIYIAVRQISESLFTQRKTLFKEAVLLEYPRRGLFSMAFTTAGIPPDMAKPLLEREAPDEPCITVFVPTTPNPTSGVLIMVPRSRTVRLDMSVQEALTFVMSAGAVLPGVRGDTRPTLLDKLESWLRHSEDSPPEEAPDAAG